MNIRNRIIQHFKKSFDLHAKGIPLNEDDMLNIDWATAMVEELFLNGTQGANDDPSIIAGEMLELSIKAGRRMYHDASHMLSYLPKSETTNMFSDRLAMWKNIFYPEKGMKDYRARLHREIQNLEHQNRELKKILKENNIDAEDDLPF